MRSDFRKSFVYFQSRISITSKIVNKNIKKLQKTKRQYKGIKHFILTAAPKTNSTTVSITVPTDYEKQNKLYREKTNLQPPTSKAGKRGEWGKERVLRVKPKGRGGKIPALTGLQFPPSPLWCHPKPRGSAPRRKTEKAAVRPQSAKIP